MGPPVCMLSVLDRKHHQGAHDCTLVLHQTAVGLLPSMLGEGKAIIISTGRIITPSTIVQLWREKRDTSKTEKLTAG